MISFLLTVAIFSLCGLFIFPILETIAFFTQPPIIDHIPETTSKIEKLVIQRRRYRDKFGD